tara:strand:+ start:680 stop:832 length:153 start_codon:yes stop_codon:yes gene_type:complete
METNVITPYRNKIYLMLKDYNERKDEDSKPIPLEDEGLLSKIKIEEKITK